MMKRFIFLGLLLLVVGIGIGYSIGFTQEHGKLVQKLSVIQPIRDHSSTYAFIDPLLAYVIPQADQDDEFLLLKQKLTNIIGEEKRKQTIEDASLFMYDLNRGRWIGVDESKEYNPASMLKVVIMVSYLKEAEKKPGMLSETFLYIKELHDALKASPFHEDSKLIPGQYYAVEDLINKMIVESDNGAELLLLHHINVDSLNYIYSALNITNPQESEGGFTISPRGYSLFFRILYSATYLSRDMSEKALEILSKTTFDDGIVAGIPETVVVSHKFGEYLVTEAGQIQAIELHDCGIVYSGENPYFLCVMTKGSNITSLKEVIKKVSEIAYQNYRP